MLWTLHAPTWRVDVGDLVTTWQNYLSIDSEAGLRRGFEGSRGVAIWLTCTQKGCFFIAQCGITGRRMLALGDEWYIFKVEKCNKSIEVLTHHVSWYLSNTQNLSTSTQSPMTTQSLKDSSEVDLNPRARTRNYQDSPALEATANFTLIPLDHILWNSAACQDIVCRNRWLKYHFTLNVGTSLSVVRSSSANCLGLILNGKWYWQS